MSNQLKTIANFKDLREPEQQKAVILQFAHSLYLKGKVINQKDLETYSVTAAHVRELFGNLRGLRNLIGVPTKSRPSNMSDEELKVYLYNITQKKQHCPGYQKPGELCYQGCSCWVTDVIKKTGDGRVRISYKGKMQFIYRVSYQLNVGPIPDGMSILHICNNPSCYKPDHLILGTDKDNRWQCVEQERHNSTGPEQPRHAIKDPNDYAGILAWVKANSVISERNEWLYPINIGPGGYPRITIQNKRYYLPRLILALKLNIPYEQVIIAGHRFPENLSYSGETPKRNDVNPDHLYNSTSEQNSIDTHEYHEGCSLSRADVQFIFDEAKNVDWLVTSAMEFDMRLAHILDVPSAVIKNVRTKKTYKSFSEKEPILTTKRAIVQLSNEGEFIARYSSREEAARAVDMTGSGISKVCTGKWKHFGGYIWMYEQTYNNRKDTLVPVEITSNKRAVVQLDMQRKFIAKYDSVADGARAIGKTKSGISNACRGRIKSFGGFIWVFETDYKSILPPGPRN